MLRILRNPEYTLPVGSVLEAATPCVDPSQSLDREHMTHRALAPWLRRRRQTPAGSAHKALEHANLEEGGERVVLAVLLDEHLEVLVDGRDRKQDARAW